MARDSNQAKRNALVIIGGLLFVYASAGVVYAEFIRSDDTLCNDGGQVLLDSVCYHVWKPMLLLLSIGAILVIWGLVQFRSRPSELEGYLHHGTGSQFTLAFLISLVVLPILFMLVQLARQGSEQTTFVIQAWGVDFEHVFLLQLAILVGVALLIPFLGLYISHDMHRRRFLAAALDDEAFSPPAKAPPAEPYPEESWPESREPFLEEVEVLDGWVASDSPAEAGYAAPIERFPPPAHERDLNIEVVVVPEEERCDAEECGDVRLGQGRYCDAHTCSADTVTGARCKRHVANPGPCGTHA